MSPKHIDKVPESIKDDRGNNIPRRAVAPYNFVELPEKVVEAESLPDGDRYHLERHTGRIECSLTTESKLYTRCGWNPEDFAKYSEPPTHKTKEEREQWEKEEKPKWEKERRDILASFFSYPSSSLMAIPGSSIRGMLRTLVEIVSFSKIERVTDRKLFYRSLGDRALQKIYSSNFIETLKDVEVPPDPKADGYRSKVHAGFLHKYGNSYVIEECGYGRIDSQFNSTNTNRLFPNLSDLAIYKGKNSPDKTPIWNLQHKTIYVEIDEQEKDRFFAQKFKRNGGERHPDLYLRFRKVNSASFTAASDLRKGTLVITGDMQHKHLEFVFLDEKLNEYKVDEEIIRRFQDDDQVTKWQEKTYSKDKPSRACRQQDGYLRDGEPVFFLLNDDRTVRFLGRAQMFRLPYEHSPLDFVPPKLKDASRTDIAEAIFGYVNGKEPRAKTCAGRVFITDGTLKPNQEEKVKSSLEKNPESILLSSPKPTTFQHYLVQQDATQVNLKQYANQPPTDTEQGETVIRGHKLYWHKDCKIEDPVDADTQTSLVKPIDPEIEFTFKIYFENLSDVELGALFWVLSLSSDKSQSFGTGKAGEKYCFSLGMGKPLGMGAVKIDYELPLSDRTSRYSDLFDGDKWKTGEEKPVNTAKKEQECVSAFEKYILDWICCEDYPKEHTREQIQHLKQLPRIEMLLAMLRCDKTPSSDQTRYMRIEPKPNEYANRPVLPTSLDVMGITDNRRFSSVNPSSGNGKNKSNESPKKKVNPSKPKLRKNSDQGQKRDGGNVNLALQRPSNRPKPKS